MEGWHIGGGSGGTLLTPAPPPFPPPPTPQVKELVGFAAFTSYTTPTPVEAIIINNDQGTKLIANTMSFDLQNRKGDELVGVSDQRWFYTNLDRPTAGRLEYGEFADFIYALENGFLSHKVEQEVSDYALTRSYRPNAYRVIAIVSWGGGG